MDICFNEAPAKRGGICRKLGKTTRKITGFNEAPAKRGGDWRVCTARTNTASCASMRPPQNAGGIRAVELADELIYSLQ